MVACGDLGEYIVHLVPTPQDSSLSSESLFWKQELMKNYGGWGVGRLGRVNRVYYGGKENNQE